jgi:hypothetical protein
LIFKSNQSFKSSILFDLIGAVAFGVRNGLTGRGRTLSLGDGVGSYTRWKENPVFKRGLTLPEHKLSTRMMLLN